MSDTKDVHKEQPEEFGCQWADCPKPVFPSLTALVAHVSNEHLAQTAPVAPNVPVRYSCQWSDCMRYNVEQPSRFALISHCRTHTGEKPYFCPVPECEKHFTRSDALAKHVKGVHDLHQPRDAVALMRYRSDTGKFDLPPGIDIQRLTDNQYIGLLQQDYALRMPWWFSQGFVDVLSESVQGHPVSVQTLLDQHLETRQHDVARLRYKRYLQSKDPKEAKHELDGDAALISPQDVAANPDLEPLQYDANQLLEQYVREPEQPHPRNLPHGKNTYEKLRSTLATASKINKVVKKNLDAAVREKRRLWVLTQALLDANIELGLSPETTGIEKDAVDGMLLRDGIE